MQKKQVLVLESDSFLLNVLVKLFEANGFASRGSQNIGAVDFMDVDFVPKIYFLDLSVMGDMSVDWVQYIRKTYSDSLCIVTYVANGPELVDLASLQNIFPEDKNCVFVEKPFDFGELKTIIQGGAL